MSFSSRLRPRLVILAATLPLLVACGEESFDVPRDRPHATGAEAAPPSVEPGPWIELDAEASHELEEAGGCIYRQGPEAPVLPVRMRTLRAPELPGVEEAVAEALRRWRFEPARLDGEPVPVVYHVTVKLEASETRG